MRLVAYLTRLLGVALFSLASISFLLAVITLHYSCEVSDGWRKKLDR
jgi:hypothetical protein